MSDRKKKELYEERSYNRDSRKKQTKRLKDDRTKSDVDLSSIYKKGVSHERKKSERKRSRERKENKRSYASSDLDTENFRDADSCYEKNLEDRHLDYSKRKKDTDEKFDRKFKKRKRYYSDSTEENDPAPKKEKDGETRREYSERKSSFSRKNSDNYWNKYPVNEHIANRSNITAIGPRYYEVDPKLNENSMRDSVDTSTNSSEKMSSVRSNTQNKDSKNNVDLKKTNSSNQKKEESLITRTGGAYIPPAKLRMMQQQITDKGSVAYQRIAWEALKKSIHGLINKVTVANISIIARELLKENIIRGKGLLCRSLTQAQAASSTFTDVYASLVAIINSKIPKIGELLLHRIVTQFKRGYKRNDKSICITASTFLAHLVNQKVAHEIIALEILTLLIESPTDNSIEIAIAFMKECGKMLTLVAKSGFDAIFNALRNILHEGNLDKRVQYMIEVMFQTRKTYDKESQENLLSEELDNVNEDDQITHIISLDLPTNPEDILNVFKHDPEYEKNEEKYGLIKKEFFGSDSDDSSGSDEEDESESEGDDEKEEDEKDSSKNNLIIDQTETNLTAFRRTIYLTVRSSVNFEESVHKLLRMEIKPGQEMELCHMILDCCAEMRTYEKFYGLLGQRFCQVNKIYILPFQQIFIDTYNTIHRLDTNKLRNAAKFFAHLLFTDAISWEVLSCILLNEEDTTSSKRIFIKILFQELSEYMGITKLYERIKDPTLSVAFEGLFPRDNPKNTRFAINFFTSIGLGGLTDELREHLKSQPKGPVIPQLIEALSSASSSSSDSSSDSSSSSSSSSDSSSETSSSDSDSDSNKKSRKKENHNSNRSIREKTSNIKESKSKSNKQSSKKYSKSHKR